MSLRVYRSISTRHSQNGEYLKITHMVTLNSFATEFL